MKFDKKVFDDGQITYYINEHRAEVFRFDVVADNLEEKLTLVEEFLQSSHARFTKVTKKEVLFAFAKIDDEVAGYYRQQYPRGGSRKNAGRKQGSLQKAPKSDRTERFTKAITKDESEFLNKALEEYRQTKEQSEDELREALKPYLRQYDDGFGDNDAARQRWRKRMLGMNPALYPYLLQYFKTFGVPESK